MAEELNMTFWYDAVYKLDSSYVHTNISATRGYMLEGEDGLLLAVGPQVFNATDILSKACELSRIILFVALNNMALDVNETLKNWDKAQSLIQEELCMKLEDENNFA